MKDAKSPKIEYMLTANINEENVDDFLRFNTYVDKILDFKEKFLKSFPNYNKEVLDFIINKLVIKETEQTLPSRIMTKINKQETLAYYSTGENMISIKNYVKNDDELLRTTLNHELLHATSIAHDRLSLGFRQMLEGDRGYMLNEGYTELLNIEYFNESDSEASYNEQVKVAKKIEEIVGKDKMQEFYFNSDLDGLINELTKYNSRFFISNILNKIDELETSNKVKKKKIMQELKMDLSALNFSKINKDFMDHKINYNEYLDLYEKHVNLKQKDDIMNADNLNSNLKVKKIKRY